jgi:opacity protein-like surface antigen
MAAPRWGRPAKAALGRLAAPALLALVLTGPALAADPAETAPPPAPAATDSAAPSFSGTFYLWGTSLSGKTSTLPPLPAVNIDASFGDILQELDGGIMGKAEMRLGRWSVLGDVMFTQVSPGGTLKGPATSKVDVRSRSLTLQGNVLYRLFETETLSLDAGAGARFWYLDNRLDIGPGGRPTRTIVTEDENWIDPLLAARISAGLGGPWGVTAVGDIGGFGVGSDLTWQAIGTLDYAVNDRLELRAGYRALSVDYEDGKFLYDVLMQGPILGATYRF